MLAVMACHLMQKAVKARNIQCVSSQLHCVISVPVMCHLCLKAALTQQLADSALYQLIDMLLNSLLQNGVLAMTALPASQHLLYGCQAVDEVYMF